MNTVTTVCRDKQCAARPPHFICDHYREIQRLILEGR